MCSQELRFLLVSEQRESGSLHDENSFAGSYYRRIHIVESSSHSHSRDDGLMS